MPSSEKTPASIRHGGPGASHENAKEPSEPRAPTATGRDAPGKDGHADVSGGGGEQDDHHTRDPKLK